MHPPGPGNGKAGIACKRPGPHEKLISNDADKLTHSTRTGQLFPVNVELLLKRGIAFTRRHGSRDLALKCPLCGGKLILDESLPWFLCMGQIHCRIQATTFEKLVEALVEKGRVK
jgi:hypothetical protein